MKKFIPFAHAKSIYDINPDFFVKLDIKYLFLDLDNTLAAHNVLTPSEETINFIENIKETGIIPIIISNNHEKRVKQFADACKVEYIFKTGKPKIKKINNFIKSKNIDKSYVIMIGDQLLTDVCCAYRLKVRCILTERLWDGDQFVTKFIRWIDLIIRKRLKRKNLLTEWEDIYGRIK